MSIQAPRSTGRRACGSPASFRRARPAIMALTWVTSAVLASSPFAPLGSASNVVAFSTDEASGPALNQPFDLEDGVGSVPYAQLEPPIPQVGGAKVIDGTFKDLQTSGVVSPGYPMRDANSLVASPIPGLPIKPSFGPSQMFLEVDSGFGSDIVLEVSYPRSHRVSPTEEMTELQTDEDAVANFGGARNSTFRGLYDSIDLAIVAFERGLKYSLIVAPGGDLDEYRVVFDNANRTWISEDGNLVVESMGFAFTDSPPVGIQKDRRLPCGFEIAGNNEVGIRCDGVDQDLTLVVDPYVTVARLSDATGAFAIDVAVDNAGNAYLLGIATSGAFAGSTGAIDTRNLSNPNSSRPNLDIFVASFNQALSQLRYVAVIGGSGDDRPYSMAIGPNGSVVVVSATDSPDFPHTAGAYLSPNRGSKEAFVLELSSDGRRLDWSAELGGEADDVGTSVAIEESGQVVVAGYTASAAPGRGMETTPNSIQPSNAGDIDGFIAILEADGSNLTFSTFLGGGSRPAGRTADDYIWDISIGPGADLVVAGETRSLDFPTTASSYSTKPSGDTDVFVTALRLSDDGVLFSTYLGGTGADMAKAVAWLPSGEIALSGTTSSKDFGGGDGNQSQPVRGKSDGFLIQLPHDGRSLLSATRIAGDGTDEVATMAVDRFGNILVGGYTTSTDLPVTSDAVDRERGPLCDIDSCGDAFVTIYDNSTQRLRYASYMGVGTEDERIGGLLADRDGSIVFGLTASSAEFPVGVEYGLRLGLQSAGIVSIDLGIGALRPPVASVVAEPTLGNLETSFQFDATGSADPGRRNGSLEFRWDVNGDGLWDANWSSNPFASGAFGKGLHSVKVEAMNIDGLSSSATITVQVVDPSTALSWTNMAPILLVMAVPAAAAALILLRSRLRRNP